MPLIRPIERCAVRIDETGVISVGNQPGDVILYAILENDVAAVLAPGDGASWRLAEVPGRAQVVLSSRFRDRRLSFPSDPAVFAQRGRLPLQDVDPAHIAAVYRGDEIAALLRRRGQPLPGDWDRDVLEQPFSETDFYKAIDARVRRGEEWSSVPDGHAVALPPGAAVDDPALTPREITSAQGVLDKLHARMRRDGYLTRAELGSGNLKDEVQVGIGRDGRYVLLAGAKRLAVARALGLDAIKVNVSVRHADWEEFRERVIGYAGQHRGRVYQRIEHPDLFDLPCHHDDDRLPLLKEAFRDYDVKGKKLVDIGPHWGGMSHAMERLGFDVTGVEANEVSAWFAEKLRDATSSRYEIWNGSIFEWPRIAEQNVILGLNIFHHFLKTEELYNGLVSMLQRSDPDIIVFAAHVDRGPDMRTAHRNYPPDEFAAFVAEHSRLPYIELLGKSHDGRSLFKLSK